jgi:hypothetical protein
VVSASVEEGFRCAADQAGADALIGKPCDPHRIVVELTRLLDGDTTSPQGKNFSH